MATTDPQSVDTDAAGRRVFLLGFGTFLIVLAAVSVYALRQQHGVFTYALDDAAIHLTLARNLVRHATFGIVPGVYQSASSSPLWEFLIGPLLLLSNDGEGVPLLVNAAAAAWALWTFSKLPWLRRVASDTTGWLPALMLPLGLGLVPLAVAGMEHTLHLAIVVQVLAILAARLRNERDDLVGLCLLLGLGTLVRFETGFLAIGTAAALLLASGGRPRRDAPAAAAVVAAAVVPVVAFAAVNRAFGQHALPNSVVAKTPVGQEGVPVISPAQFLDKLLSDPVLVVALAGGTAALVLWRRGPDGWMRTGPLLAMLLTTVAHLLFAEIGWFERYQAYLLAGIVFAVLLAAPIPGPATERHRAAMILCALSLLRVPLLINTPIATGNVYDTEYHLGRFLAQAYPGQGIAVNDIGYVSWLHEGDVVDVVGLADYELLQARKERRLSPAFTAAVFERRGIRVMAVHDEFFAAIVPAGWQAGGRWCLTTRRLAVSSACVTFYALRGTELDRLRAALDAFSPRLPASVAYTTA